MNVHALSNLGVVQVNRGDFPEAEKTIRKALAYDYDSGPAHYLLGVIYLRAPLKPATPSRGLPQLFIAVVCAVATLVFGCYPQPLLNLTQKAAPVPTVTPTTYVMTK